MSCFFSYNHHKSQANKIMVNYLTYFFLWVTLSGCWYILSERPKSLVNFVLQHRSDSHRFSAVFIQMKDWMVFVNLVCWFVKDMIFLRMMPLTYFLNVLVGQLNFTSSNSSSSLSQLSLYEIQFSSWRVIIARVSTQALHHRDVVWHMMALLH